MQWLQRRGTVEEFEQEALRRKSDSFGVPLDKAKAKLGERPFGTMTDSWKKFVENIESEDELWFFSSPPESFSKELGCNGFAILRDGKIHRTLVMVRT